MIDLSRFFPRERLPVFFVFLVITMWYGCSQNTAPKVEGMVYIPKGEFTIGSNDADKDTMGKEFGARDGAFFANEGPSRKIYLKSFYIDRFEITNKKYELFVIHTKRLPPPNWKKEGGISGRKSHPVNYVSWHDADTYCRWEGKRLPTEEEWEKAARGPKGNKYVWGNEFDENNANFQKGDTVPVGSMAKDKSYFGVYDMAGNLSEWTSSWYKPYPGSTLNSADFGEIFKVTRGGAGNHAGHYKIFKIFSRSSYRYFYKPGGKIYDLGFRCAKDGVSNLPSNGGSL